MKTKNVMLTLGALIVSAFAFAGNGSKLVVVSQQAGTYKVIYSGETAGKVTMKIYDNNGREIFAETTKGMSKFIRPVNFSGMEAGTYSIEVIDNNGKQVQTVNYEIATSVASTLKGVHVSKLQNGKYLLSVVGNSNDQINVQIFDGNDNLVHDKSQTVNGDLGLVYNLKQIENPVFTITDNSGAKYTVK